METRQVLCDGCGKDLSVTDYVPAYRLCLDAERIPVASNKVAAIHVVPPIDRAYHFCGTHCLFVWLEKKP